MPILRTTATVTVLAAACAVVLSAQQRGGTPRTDAVAPVNTGANPYRVIREIGRAHV